MRYSILVVDDTVTNLQLLSSILNEEYDVKIAKNGKAALKIVEKKHPDLILLDVMMPELNGYQVCQKLKSNPNTSSIPVIFVTALSSDYDEDKGYEVGGVDYITKPINVTTVKNRVKTHLSLSNQSKLLEMQVAEKTEDLNNSRLDLIECLGRAAEYRDNDTGNHISRVSEFSEILSKKLNLDSKEIELIKLASSMHDIGKIGIPDGILNKKGKLSDDEFLSIKQHTLIGESILGSQDDPLLSLAKIIAAQHHEKWNGKGYPRGLKGEEIQLASRIISVVDVFDALVSKRPYKEAWSFDEAYEYVISQSGEHFDPKVVDCFKDIKEEFYEIYEKYSDIS